MTKKSVKKRIQKKKPIVKKKILDKIVQTEVKPRPVSGRDRLIQNRISGIGGGSGGGFNIGFGGGSGGSGSRDDALNKMETERKARYEAERLNETLKKTFEEEKKLRIKAQEDKTKLKEEIRQAQRKEKEDRKNRNDFEKLESKKRDLIDALENGVSEEKVLELRSQVDDLQRQVDIVKNKEKVIDENIRQTPLIGKIMDLKSEQALIQSRIDAKTALAQGLIDQPVSELEKTYGQQYVNTEAKKTAEKMRDEINKNIEEQRKYIIEQMALGDGMSEYWKMQLKDLQDQLINEENTTVYQKNEADKARVKQMEYTDRQKLLREMRNKRIRAETANRIAREKSKIIESGIEENNEEIKKEESSLAKTDIENQKLKEREIRRKEMESKKRENDRLNEEKKINDIIDSGNYKGKDPQIISIMNLEEDIENKQIGIGREKAKSDLLKREKTARDKNVGLRMNNIRKSSENTYVTTEDGVQGMARLSELAVETGNMIGKKKQLEEEGRSAEEVRKIMLQNEVNQEINNGNTGPGDYLQVMDKAKTLFETASNVKEMEMKERRELVSFLRDAFNRNIGLWDTFKRVYQEQYENLDDTIFGNNVEMDILRDVVQKVRIMLDNGEEYYR